MLNDADWVEVQTRSMDFTPGWASLKGTYFAATAHYQALDIAWEEGLLVPGPNETSLGLYVADVQMLLTADSNGRPTVLTGSSTTEVLPIVSAKGLILFTDKRVVGRLSDGYYVKTVIFKEQAEFFFAALRSDLVSLEVGSGTRRDPEKLTMVFKNTSHGAVQMLPTHLINRDSEDSDSRFVPVTSRQVADLWGPSASVAATSESRSGGEADTAAFSEVARATLKMSWFKIYR